MPVEVLGHDPSWVVRFEQERALLEPVLTPWLEGGVHHVGSTAVPGLAAKPVVDILAGVADVGAARAAVPALEGFGYLYWPEDPNRAWRLWFLKPDPARRTHHLQLIEPGHPRFAALLAFRDRLRSDPELRDAYERLKRRLAAEHRGDREAYTEAKAGFVARATRPGAPPG
jgi:GrpB-like predicted nucleotidyltransferase (UPF0157 family)